MTGTEMIEAERERQIASEGWTYAHDDEHVEGELARAAAAYALATVDPGSEFTREACEDLWPFENDQFTPCYGKSSGADVIVRDLVRAGALIAAEIDRVQRAEARADAVLPCSPLKPGEKI